jgi:hypothetical protein
MARVDAQPLGQLAVGQLRAALAELPENAESQRVTERLQLCGVADSQNLAACHAYI